MGLVLELIEPRIILVVGVWERVNLSDYQTEAINCGIDVFQSPAARRITLTSVPEIRWLYVMTSSVYVS